MTMTTPTLPLDPDGMNYDRAEMARDALQHFGLENNLDSEDLLADLLTNLMHWCDRSPLVFADELTRAQRNYRSETTPEGTL